MTETLIHEGITTGTQRRSDEVGRLLHQGFALQASGNRNTDPQSNLLETWESYFLQIAVPGIATEKLQIEIVARHVIVRGERQVAKIDGGSDLWRDIPGGTFELMFDMPAEVDSDQSEAHYLRGILTVRIPKIARIKSKFVKVCVIE